MGKKKEVASFLAEKNVRHLSGGIEVKEITMN